MRILDVVNSSIIHWRENLDLLLKADRWKNDKKSFVVSVEVCGELREVFYDSDSCQLCNRFSLSCDSLPLFKCPLAKFQKTTCGDHDGYDNTWIKFRDADSKEDLIKYAKAMIDDLENCKDFI